MADENISQDERKTGEGEIITPPESSKPSPVGGKRKGGAFGKAPFPKTHLKALCRRHLPPKDRVGGDIYPPLRALIESEVGSILAAAADNIERRKAATLTPQDLEVGLTRYKALIVSEYLAGFRPDIERGAAAFKQIQDNLSFELGGAKNV